MSTGSAPPRTRNEASVLAHELNNLLGVILGNVEILDEVADDAAPDESLDAIRRAATAAIAVAERVRLLGVATGRADHDASPGAPAGRSATELCVRCGGTLGRPGPRGVGDWR
jgi:signal transduction histidine kinase